MKRLVLLISLLSIASCGGGNRGAKNVNLGNKSVPGSDSGSDSTNGGSGSTGSTGGQGGSATDGVSLELLSDKGSAMRFLDADGLQVIYAKVFEKGPLGYAHCTANSLPRDPKICEGIFAEDERSLMGTFDLYSPRMKRGISNVGKTTNLTLNYMRSLRAALGRECTKLVDKEQALLKSNPKAETALVLEGNATAAKIERYFRLLNGIKDDAIAVDIDASGYASDFATLVKEQASTPQVQRLAYINLCIAVSMDPQIFLY